MLQTIHNAAYSHNQKLPLCPPCEGGKEGGVKKLSQKKKFLQGNIITH